MRKVLIAYDGSSGAKQALEDLKRNRAGLPKDTQVIVLCVADVWTPTRFASFGAYGLEAAPMTASQLQVIQKAEQAALKSARQLALKASKELHGACPSWEVRAESCAHAPGWGIVKRAEEWKADLIVMGSHGRSMVGRLLLGSVSHTVVRESPCTVRIVRGRIGKRGAPVHLVVGFDGSSDAGAALLAIAQREWPPGSAVRLVTAIGDPLASAIPSLRWAAARHSREAMWIRDALDDSVHRLRTAGLTVIPVAKRGDPRKVLVREVKRWDADSLFVGARGLRGVKRFLLGSVSTAVAMQTPCPIEVVRSDQRNASGSN